MVPLGGGWETVDGEVVMDKVSSREEEGEEAVRVWEVDRTGGRSDAELRGWEFG